MHIGIKSWIKRVLEGYRNGGMKFVLTKFFWWYVGFFITISSRKHIGTNIFEKDWDMVIILDACRVDAMREVANEYSFIDSVGEYYSVGSTSNEWIAKTFTRKFMKDINETNYVTSNLFGKKVLEDREFPPIRHPYVPLSFANWNTVDISDLNHFEPVWQYAEHAGSGGFPARPVTDRSIQLCRGELASSRTIVHYMQPHSPYIAVDEPIKKKYNNNDIDKEEVWNAYLDNLRYVLEEVEILINNVDAEKVVITADHGEAFDEWGFRGHTLGNPIPEVKKVPWVETTAHDTKSHNPQTENKKKLTDDEIESRLSYLGYK